jgi:hypothetical protein
MDMARKFLQMGYTRARRYTNHKGGRKYGPDGKVLPYISDPVKAESAAIFRAKWQEAKADPEYQEMARHHNATCINTAPPGAKPPRYKPKIQTEPTARMSSSALLLVTTPGLSR